MILFNRKKSKNRHKNPVQIDKIYLLYWLLIKYCWNLPNFKKFGCFIM